MSNTNYPDTEGTIRCGVQVVYVLGKEQKFAISLFMHRVWHDHQDMVSEMWHHGRVRWNGAPPEVQLPTENTDT